MHRFYQFKIILALSAFMLLSALAKAQTQTHTSPDKAIVVNTFPFYHKMTKSSGGAKATTMKGTCNVIACCSVWVYRVDIPAPGSIRIDNLNWTPLGGSAIGYQAIKANPTLMSDLTYKSGPGNFCGFRDSMVLGYGYTWSNPRRSGNSQRKVDWNGTDTVGAGSYYFLCWNRNVQSSIGSDTATFQFRYQPFCPNGYICGTQSINLCDETSFKLPGGNTVTQSGNYTDTLKGVAAGGLDSLIFTSLSIGQSSITQNTLTDESLCIGDDLKKLPTTNKVAAAVFEMDNDDWIEINDVAGELAGTNRSVFTWMRKSSQVSGSTQMIHAINTSSNGNVCLLQIATDEELELYDGSNSRTTGVKVTDGEWHHVGYTYDESTDSALVYVDGKVELRFKNSQTVSATNKMSIGQEFDSGSKKGNFYDGELTDMTIWSEVLSAADVKSIMQSSVQSTHPKYSNLEAYYPMITSCSTSADSLYDFSGNGLTGFASSNTIQNRDSLRTIMGFESSPLFKKQWFDGTTLLASTETLNAKVATYGSHSLRLYRDYYEITDEFDVVKDASCITVVPAAPEIKLTYNSTEITDGSTATSTSDGTDFGTEDINTTAVKITYTITNTGPDGDTLHLTGSPIVTLSGSGASHFSVTSQPSKAALDSGETVTFQVSYLPTTVAAHSATISLANDDADENPYTFNIKGEGKKKSLPEIKIIGSSGKEIDDGNTFVYVKDSTHFGKVVVSTTPVVTTYRIINKGDAGSSLNLTGSPIVTISGTNASFFSIKTQPAKTALSAGETTFVKVSYLPTSLGAHTAALSIANNDANENPYDINIGGTGIAPAKKPEIEIAYKGRAIVNGSVVWDPYHATDFGTVDANKTVSTTYYVKNLGDTALTLNATPVTNTGAKASEFTITTQPTGPIAVGDSSAFVVSFKPTAAGAVSTTISVGSNDADENPSTFVVRGVGLKVYDPKDYFITKWKTDASGTNATNTTSIQVSIKIGATYDYDIDWENDGVFDTFSVKGDAIHNYGVAGTYTVAIRGQFAGTYFFSTSSNPDDNDKLVSVEQWGNTGLTTLQYGFRDCINFGINAIDTPDLSQVTTMHQTFWNVPSFNNDISGWDVSSVKTMQGLFFNCKKFNIDISGWDVSKVTDMAFMFNGASIFNQDISSWKVGNVTSMRYMFANTGAFNQDISKWDVSKVTHTGAMFSKATSFNQDIGNWNVKAVTNMFSMFAESAFNQDIGDWDVSSVTNLNSTFSKNRVFNQDISGWDVSAVTGMYRTFKECYRFNQDIGDWDVSAVTNMNGMLYNTSDFDQNLGAWDMTSVTDLTDFLRANGLSKSNYDSLLIGWAKQNLNSNLKFNAGNSDYCLGNDARDTLINKFNWTITDGAKKCGMTVNFTLNDLVTCKDSSDAKATASLTGGIAPFTYSWSNGDTALSADSLGAGMHYFTSIDAVKDTVRDSIFITQPMAVVASISIDQDASCFGLSDGKATGSATGGTGSYTYLWSTNETTASTTASLGAGAYSLIVTDQNGCNDQTSTTIGQPKLLEATAIIDSHSVKGPNTGGASASATGGTSPYTFSWSTSETSSSISGIDAGTFIVTITDKNACTDKDTVTILSGVSLNLAINGHVSCYGLSDGKATAAFVGGLAPFSYLWSNGDTTLISDSLKAGIYTFRIIDASKDTTIDSIEINEPELFNVNIASSTNLLCAKDSSGSAVAQAKFGIKASGSGLAETFDHFDSIPAGWSSYNNFSSTAANAFWKVGSVSGSPNYGMQGTVEHTGNSGYFIWVDGSSPYPGKVSLETPMVVNSSAFNFWMKRNTIGQPVTKYNDFTIDVYDGTNWHDSIFYHDTMTASGDWEKFSINISSYLKGDSVKLRLNVDKVAVSSPFYDDLVLDDISFEGEEIDYVWKLGADTISQSKELTKAVATTYKVIATSSKGCVDSTTLILTEPSALASSKSTADVSCYMAKDGNASVAISGGTSPYTYTWNNASSNDSIKGLDTDTFSVLVTDDHGCTLNDTVIITQPDSLIASIVIDSHVTCHGLSNGGMTVKVTGGTVSYTYAWDNASTAASATHLKAGVYNVIVSDANGCTAKSTQTITQPTLLVAGTIDGDTMVCSGATPALLRTTSATTGGVGSYTYLWQQSTDSLKWTDISGATSATYQPGTIRGNNWFRRIGSDGNRCGPDTTNVLKVGVFAQPSTGFTATAACEGEQTFFTDTTSLAFGTITSYAWSFGDQGTSNQQNPINIYKKSGNYTVTLEVIAGGGCNSSMTKTVNVSAMPTMDFSTSTECQGTATAFTNKSAISAGTLSYAWDLGDKNSSTTTSPSHTYTNAGYYTVQLTATSDKGCIDSLSRTVQVKQVAKPNFSATSVCEDKTTRFTNLSTNGSSYSWDFGNSKSSSQSNPKMAYGKAANYTVVLTATSSDGCSDTARRQVMVYGLPSPSFSASEECEGDATSFTNTTAGTNTYQWIFGDGTSSNKTAPSQLYGKSGSYNVALTATTAEGCMATSSKTITVNALPAASFTAADICQSETLTTSNSSTGAATYLWTLGDGKSSTATAPTHSYSSHGSYQVKLEATSSKGCVASEQKTINAYAVPQVKYSAANACFGYDVNFKNQSKIAAGTLTYVWNLGDASTSGNPSPSHNYGKDGTYNIKLIATSNQGCKDSTTGTVSVYERPTVAFTSSTECEGTSTTFTNSSSISTGTMSYQWSLGDGTKSKLTPSHAYASNGMYAAQLIATSDQGCIDSITKSVIVHDMAEPNFTATSVCEDATTIFTNLTTNSQTYEWTFGDGNSSKKEKPTHAYGKAGSYTAILKATTSKGCSDTFQRKVAVYALPIPVFSATEVCDGYTTSFTNSTKGSNSYQWTFGNGTASSKTSPSLVYAKAGSYTAELTATSAEGCIASIDQTVIVNALPQVAFSANDVCQSKDLQTSNNTTGATKYTWTFGDGSSSTATAPSHGYSKHGRYHLAQVATTAKGCVDSASTKINVFAEPKVAYTSTDVCYGLATDFTNTSRIATGSMTFNWNLGNGTTSGNPSPSYIYSKDGSYTIKLVATSNQGCKDSTTGSVDVYPMPQVRFTTASECYGDTLFTDNTTTGASKYAWNFGDGSSSTATAPFRFYAKAGSYDVQLIATTNRNCVDSHSQSIQMYSKPIAAFEMKDVCDQTTVDFSNNSYEAIISQNNWDFGDSQTESKANPSHVYAAAGSYDATLIVISNEGCSDTLTKSVTIHPNPVTAFTHSTECDYDSTKFSNTSTISSGTMSYDWNFGLSQNSTREHPSHLFGAASKYSVVLTATSDQGCEGQATEIITVDPSPQAAIQVANNCEEFMTPFASRSTVSSGDVNGYEWDFGDGNNALVEAPTHLYQNDGIYSIELIVKTDQDCYDTTTATVEIYNKPTADFASPDICFSELSVFTDGSVDAQDYLYDFGDKWGISTLAEPEYTYEAPGSYQAILYVTSANGCKDTVTKTIEIFELPEAAFAAESHCYGEDFMPTDDSKGNVIDWNWTYGNGDDFNGIDPIYLYPEDGSYQVRLLVEDVNGCQDTMSQTVVVWPLPKVWVRSDTMVSRGYTVPLLATGGVAYKWDPVDMLEGPLKADPIATVVEDITYTVTVANEFGCVRDTFVNLRVEDDYTLEPTNILTPDGNGKNDLWVVEKAQYYNDVEVIIFDRMGRIVYQNKSYDNSWDGTNLSGNPLPEGAYFYLVIVPTEREEYKGSITIFK